MEDIVYLIGEIVPNIDLIPEVYYNALNPYHYHYDNLPLRNILTRISLVNSTVDVSYNILRESIGTQGTLSNRLNQSINQNGSLKSQAIDQALHNIGSHADGEYLGVEYVRMKRSESEKLELIADNATDLKLIIPNNSSTVLFNSGTVEFQNSTGITWTITAGNKVKANLGFSNTAIHNHHYEITPIHNGDYKTYQTTSVSTPYISGTLRVYINGIRINSQSHVYVPVGSSRTLTLMKLTPNNTQGTFILSTAITSLDTIKIDFDTAYV